MHHVAYCFDANYQQHFAASLSSLVTTYGGKSSELKVHVVTDVANDKLEQFLRDFSARTGIAYEIHYLTIEHRSLLAKIPAKFLNSKGYLNLAAYFRIMLPILVGDEVHKILYLDSDTIVMSDVSELFDLDLGGLALGAVLDVDNEAMCRDHGYKAYFNSGVMILDLALWRAQDLAKKCLDHVWDENSNLLMADQCAINRVLSDNIFIVDARWNRFVSNTPFSQSQSDEVIQNAAVIHFITSQKPWFAWYENKVGDLYLSSLRASQWPSPVSRMPKTVNEHLWTARKLNKQGKHKEAISFYEILVGHLLKKVDGPASGA
ncbi:glycosyltransferase family 8 protein [Caulobacter henricii]|uniref:Uncharacterized protein n=1 Tax=Caulobacter henricii TaxID=69395 RepID=A0A0P0NXG4_9CAUL|nr:glycosyltransferase family 8 protein [Caulobacter henricii]ALL12468.1 hypothetical protein AQ619_03360 [Caulobacter henricii]